MRKINSYIKLAILLFCFVFWNSYCYSQEKTQIRIAGEIIGLPDNTKLSLIKGDDIEPSDTIQRAVLKNGKFAFSGSGLNVGKMYFIILDTTIFKFPSRRSNWVRLIAEPNVIKISGNISTWPKVDLMGATATKVYEGFHAANAKYISKINNPEVGIDSIRKAKILEEWKTFIKTYARKAQNSFATPLLIMKSQALSSEEKNKIFIALPKATQNSFYGKELEKYLETEMIRSRVSLGKEIPDFKLITPEGKAASIKELIGKHKLTLIDFWASWCSPCRAAIPHLKEVYAQFKDRGFNIIGIVTKANEKDVAWKKALTVDQTPWTQGMDMTNISNIYFPKAGIPSYVLVDGAGKLVATSLTTYDGKGMQGPGITGKELIKTLETLLGSK